MSIFRNVYYLLDKQRPDGPWYLALDGAEVTTVLANALRFDFPDEAAAYLHRHARALPGFIVIDAFTFASEPRRAVRT